MLTTGSNILALDVGSRRIGVAIASTIARLPHPLMTIEQSEETWQVIADKVKAEDAGMVIIGLPRGMQGQHTEQTRVSEQFAEELRKHIDVPVVMQDETLTSVKAETELQARGQKMEKGMVDALAATYILEDYLRDHQELSP